MSPEKAHALGVEAGEAEAREARDPWAMEWPCDDNAWDTPQGRAVEAAREGEGWPLVEAFRDGWAEGVEAGLAVRRGLFPLRAGRDAGGVRFFVGDTPVRTGGPLALALADGTALHGRLEVTDEGTAPWFAFNVAGASTAGEASFPVKASHRFHPRVRQ